MGGDGFDFDEAWRRLAGTFPGTDSSSGPKAGPDFSSLFEPVAPYNRWPSLVPLVSLAGGVAVIALTGLAVASMAVMGLALVMVVFLLVEVFGYELAVPTPPR